MNLSGIDTAYLKNSTSNHPYLFYSDERFEELNSDSVTEKEEQLKEVIIYNAQKTVEKYKIPDFDTANSGENDWISNMGEQLPELAVAFRLTGEKQYFNKGIEMINALLSYPKWASASTEDGNFNELAASGAFTGIALFYDWCYDDIDIDSRARIADGLLLRCKSMIDGSWWRAAYLQNHMATCISSCFIAAAAIADTHPEAVSILQSANVDYLSKIINLLPVDGAASEGHMYYEESMTSLVKIAMLNEALLGKDVLNHIVFSEAMKFPIYNTIPSDSRLYYMDQFYFGDAPYYSYFNMAAFTEILANVYCDPVAHSYVDYCIDMKYQNKTKITDTVNDWLLLSSYNGKTRVSLPPELSDDYPENKIFNDLGYVYMKDSWNGSDALALKCGPIFGKKAADFVETYLYDLGAGHQHPDINSFSLISNGEWLFKDDGYTTGITSNHNTLLINGLGQFGDADTFEKLGGTDIYQMIKRWTTAKPEIIKNIFADEYAYVVCDGTDAYYKDEMNISSIVRHFLYVRDMKTLLIIDSVKSTEENNYSIRFIPAFQNYTSYETGYLFESDNNKMLIDVFNEDASVTVKKENLLAGKTGATEEAVVLNVENKVDNWDNAVAISWSDFTNLPHKVLYNTVNDEHIFTFSDNYEISINISDKTVNIIK